MIIDNQTDLNKHIIDCYPREACGLVVDNKYIACNNIAHDPINDFRISDDDYLKYADELQGVIHSHTYQHGEAPSLHRQVQLDRRSPSAADMAGQIATDVPWGIVATDGENVTEILWFGDGVQTDLIGRPFIHSVYDCFTLCRDYYKQHNVFLDHYVRPVEWQQVIPKLYEDNWQKEGFVQVGLNDIQVGDFIYLRIAHSFIDHAGVYLGDDQLLHHLHNRLSGIDSLSKWHKHIAMVLRHPNYQS